MPRLHRELLLGIRDDDSATTYLANVTSWCKKARAYLQDLFQSDRSVRVAMLAEVHVPARNYSVERFKSWCHERHLVGQLAEARPTEKRY